MNKAAIREVSGREPHDRTIERLIEEVEENAKLHREIERLNTAYRNLVLMLHRFEDELGSTLRAVGSLGN